MEKLKDQTNALKYRIRDEIEKIMKAEKIDRNRFYEYSKFAYKNIIKNLNVLKRFSVGNYEWKDFLQKLHSSMPITKNNKFCLILSQGWVYKGYADEIFSVLNEADGLLEDFYIVARNFDWCISYCGDGEYAEVLQR